MTTPEPPPFSFDTVFGVDFSGARLAGRNAWLARLELTGDDDGGPPLRLEELRPIESLCGSAARAESLGYLVARIGESSRSLWALDFPFGLPVEVFDQGTKLRWAEQFDFFREWGDDAYGLGLECLRRAKTLGGPNHIRRQTDTDAKAPFDCYHYRIIYQTFYGIRDVLGPLRNRRGTAILPFHYRRLKNARRVLVEACPSSTLKRLGLPHQNYKQAQGGPLTRRRRVTRRHVVDGIAASVEIPPTQRRSIMRNPGADALDAVIAGLGGWQSWLSSDHRALARHPRYPREGRLYV